MVKGILMNKSVKEVDPLSKMEHVDLIAEIHTIENLPTQERLHLARMRRAQQLKVARQKEKEWARLQRGQKNLQNQSSKRNNRRHIKFQNSVVLLEAASRNDIQEVATLLQHGITPDAANEDGLTALHQCCIDNNIEMLKLLLDYGANVDAQDSDKWTPLHAAATCGHLNLVKILIANGANLLAVNTDGNMPYDLCDDEDTLDFIEAEMSKRGVTQELIDETRALTEKQMLSDLINLAKLGGDLEMEDSQGATPLHVAAANGFTRVVSFLLENHVKLDVVDKDLWTPVHAAACWGHMEVLDMLAQYGADLNSRNKDDETPSDICEDPEIRDRIELLKTEQESKRLAEQQKRRVRRSQSNNTRAQSVRRTSLRDKTLTTKKDAVEETRLRLQAQEVLIVPSQEINSAGSIDSSKNRVKEVNTTSFEPNSIISNSSNKFNVTVSSIEREEIDGSLGTIRNSISSNEIKKHKGNDKISNNNSNTYQRRLNDNGLNNNNNELYDSYVNKNGPEKLNKNNREYRNNISSKQKDVSQDDERKPNSSNYHYEMNNMKENLEQNILPVKVKCNVTSRLPPDGIDNEENNLSNDVNFKKNKNFQNEHSNFEPNKIDNGFSNANLDAQSSTITKIGDVSSVAEVFQTSKENGKINVQVTVLLDTHNFENALNQQPTSNTNGSSTATLANLKKQRSQSRTAVYTENNISSNPLSMKQQSTYVKGLEQNQMSEPTALSPILNNNLNKFCGITSDVVSDSTNSKKCCILM